MSGPLTHSTANIMQQLLISKSQGTNPLLQEAWPVHYSMEPDTPDKLITVYSTADRDHGRTMVDGRRQVHHGFQVRVRSRKHDAGFTKAHAILIVLDESTKYETVTISGTQYRIYAVTTIGGVIDIGKEAGISKRNLFTINAVVALKQL